MAVYPVIMCGGSGLRLWPASRPWRPKQFLPLTGELSSFQETVRRVQPLGGDSGLVVVAGAAHASWLRPQLAALGARATVLLEPEPRDSAAAIAAACAWIVARDPDGVAVIVSADHHVPDAAAFRRAVDQTLEAAKAGAIVTLGVRPTEPSTAYGYIQLQPSATLPAPVQAFVEKPDRARAEAYVAAGHLWNSGNFVARAETLLSELKAWAPGVAEAAEAAVADAAFTDGAGLLGEVFRTAPKISIDYAVMEKTRRAAVLPVDFEWSDVGAWDAVLAVAPKDGQGNSAPASARLIRSANVLVRAPRGVAVGVAGLSDIAVVVESDAVLVCALDAAQEVKTLSSISAAPRFSDLSEAASAYDVWLRTAALPLWATVGVEGVFFREGLTPLGTPAETRRRMRTQSRQVFVFASAAASGMVGPWRDVALRGFQAVERGRREDGAYANAFDFEGRVSDADAYLYEQAFVLLALEALHRADPAGSWRADADRLGERLGSFRHAAGGFREVGARPFQANAQMHLFEASLALGGAFDPIADEIADLALSSFIDPRTGVLREFFDADWRPLSPDQNLIEPGHHFEWAWLLTRWGQLRGHARGRAAAEGLYAAGLKGVDRDRSVAVGALNEDMSVRDPVARLWPQTEWLRVALALGREDDALAAASGLWRYLQTPAWGAWRDKLRPDGGFVDEASPATSFYHLMSAIQELTRRAR